MAPPARALMDCLTQLRSTGVGNRDGVAARSSADGESRGVVNSSTTSRDDCGGN
jgi:hypothetical protein